MKKKWMILATAAVSGMLIFSACGSGNDASKQETAQTEEVKEESAAPETTEEAKEEAAPEKSDKEAEETTEETKEDTKEESKEDSTEEAKEETDSEEAKKDAEEDDASAEASDELDPYAWLGLSEMPKCDYMDDFSTYHYITTYDSYAGGFVVEETSAVDGINTYTENENSRSYSVDGQILSINENSKIYMETDMGSLAEVSKEQMKSAMETGNNIIGRAYVGTGSDSIPLYSDEGDSSKYDYYEFNYPAAEESGVAMIERYYMKDGDVFAIYTKTTMGETEVESTKVIKSMSGDIPDGTFDLPDLSGYEKYEV